MNITIDNLGEFLNTKRKLLNKTLMDVSSAIELSIGYISRIENGSSIPSLETLYKLSCILNFKIEDVCEFSDVELNKNEPVNIEDLFKAYDIKINSNKISDLKKFQMVKLLTTIENMNWTNELNRIANISDIIFIVDQIKKGE